MIFGWGCGDLIENLSQGVEKNKFRNDTNLMCIYRFENSLFSYSNEFDFNSWEWKQWTFESINTQHSVLLWNESWNTNIRFPERNEGTSSALRERCQITWNILIIKYDRGRSKITISHFVWSLKTFRNFLNKKEGKKWETFKSTWVLMLLIKKSYQNDQ